MNTPRTRTGARLVELKEKDPVTERGTALGEAHGDYMNAYAAAVADYRTESQAAWARFQTRLAGAAADYQSQVERIRKPIGGGAS